MAVDVLVPAVGESVKEGMIHRWVKQDGDYVKMDEVLVELETDKATVEIVAQASGALKILKKAGETVLVGTPIANIDTNASAPAASAAVSKPADAKASEAASPGQPAVSSGSSAPLSPAVNRMVTENKLDPRSISGTGKSGRVTKEDVVNHLEKGPAKAATVAPSSGKVQPTAAIMTPVVGSRGSRKEPMSMLRRRIAERLVSAQHTAAILTTFNEIDMSQVMALRSKYKESFKDKFGVNLGFMSFFVKACVEALRAYPAINGSIEGTDIVYHDYCDIGVAVSSDKGLVVPVVKNCEALSLAGLEAAIAGYAVKARDGKISIDDLSGGTFTVSNGGVFGSLLSTPILNPPQSAILGMHKTEQRAVVVDGQIVIRPMMYVALSYDHRIVDGKEAVSFLVKVKECIEDPSRMLLGV